MAQEIIDVGTAANDRTGDTWRNAMIKSNNNFTEIFTAIDKIKSVFVSQESDFPTQDATTITLEEEVVYIVTESFTTAKRFICENSSGFVALNQVGPIVTYTGTGSMFSGQDASFGIMGVRIDCANATAFNFVDVSPLNTSVIAISRMFINNCDTLGTFTSLASIAIDDVGALDVNDGITLDGTGWRIWRFQNLGQISTSATFTGFDIGSASAFSQFWDNNTVSAPAGGIGLTGLANSGNVPVGTVAKFRDTNFIGGVTTPLVNISEEDIRWSFRDNSIIPDSRNTADAYLTGGTETITISTAGVFVEIGVPSAGGVSWASDVASRFTVGTDGVITYVGEKDITAQIIARATVEKVGGGSDQLEVRLAKNWVAPSAGIEKSRAVTQNATATSVPVSALVELSQNDDIRVIFANNTTTADIDAIVTSIEINA